MEQINTEACYNKLLELGAAMFDLLNGKKLNDNQIEMIKRASDKQKVLGLQLLAAYNLSDQKYTNYCHNIREIGRK